MTIEIQVADLTLKHLTCPFAIFLVPTVPTYIFMYDHKVRAFLCALLPQLPCKTRQSTSVVLRLRCFLLAPLLSATTFEQRSREDNLSDLDYSYELRSIGAAKFKSVTNNKEVLLLLAQKHLKPHIVTVGHSDTVSRASFTFQSCLRIPS